MTIFVKLGPTRLLVDEDSAPVWSPMPDIEFTLGVPGVFPITVFCEDPEGADLTFVKNAVLMNPGVMFNANAIQEQFEYDGSGADVSTTVGHVLTASDAVVTPPVTPSVDDFPNFDDNVPEGLLGNGPTWNYADSGLYMLWAHPGGDWIDANGASQGLLPFASLAITSAPVDGQILTWTSPGMLLLVDRLRAKNTGIYIKANGTTGTHQPYIWSREAPPQYPKPRLQIVTDAGSYDLTPTADTFLEVLQPAYYQGQTYDYLSGVPICLKFDLSGVVGLTQSAALLMTSSYPNTTTGYSLEIYYLDMPTIISYPATQVGGVLQGIANTVTNDLALATHPSVLHYTDYSSKYEPTAMAEWETNNNYPPVISTFVDLPEYGITLIRWRSFINTADADMNYANRIVDAARLVTLSNGPNNTDFHRPLGSGYNKLYFRFLIMLEEPMPDLTNQGMKLPGMGGGYRLGWVAPPTASNTVWDTRNFTATLTRVNRRGSFGVYYYGADALADGTGAGTFGPNLIPFKWAMDTLYCVEQYVELNTPNPAAPGGYNSDGIIRVWIDGVKILDVSNKKMRIDPNAQIQEVPWIDIYHGGAGPGTYPLGEIFFRFGGCCMSEEYIGPPKRIA